MPGPLCDSEGRTLGILVMLHGQPLQNEQQIRLCSISLLRVPQPNWSEAMRAEQEKLIAELQKLVDLVSISHKEWRETFDSITDMIFILDRDMTVLRANRAVEKCWEYLSRRFWVKSALNYFKGQRDFRRVRWTAVYHDRQPVTAEMHESRLQRFFEVTAIPRFSSTHDLIGLIHIIRTSPSRRNLKSSFSMRRRWKLSVSSQGHSS